VDLLEDAGIPPPRSPFLTDEDRAALASMALAQRQFYYVFTFFVGLILGAGLAYEIGYGDIIGNIFRWTISGTGIALLASILNISKLASFKCPRCDQAFFVSADSPFGIFSKQCCNCGLPLELHDQGITDAI
jgi:hypothetical protein